MNIKTIIGNYLLKKELSKQHRHVEVTNLSTANKVGILYYAEDEATYKTVKEFVGSLREEEGIRKIKTIGYVDKKEVPEHFPLKLEFDYFSKKDLNWYQKPSCIPVDNFLQEDFDILIDLSVEEHYPLKYLLTHTKAKFKVGKQHQGKNAIFDMRIELEQVKSLRFLITQLKHYLNIINKPQAHVEQI